MTPVQPRVAFLPIVFLAALAAAPTPKFSPEEADKIAREMVYGRSSEHYINRKDALLMDDRPEVREALKRLVVKDALMYEYQAALFDDGFGKACRALQIARDAIEEEKPGDGPEYPIQR